MTIPKTLPKWVKSWCCQAVAQRFGSDLRCSCCGNMLFADAYNGVHLYIVDGEPYDPSETVPNPFYKEPRRAPLIVEVPTVLTRIDTQLKTRTRKRKAK